VLPVLTLIRSFGRNNKPQANSLRVFTFFDAFILSMKEYFILIIYLAFASLPLKLHADDHTADQQTKIQQIQKIVRNDLMTGDILHASNTLDEAASNFHSEKLELAMVQTLMQAGEYRQAISRAAHVQAEHQNFSDATLFYAWLLVLGGQTQPAKKLLSATIKKHATSDLMALLAQVNKGQFNSSAFKPENIHLGPVKDIKSLINGKFLSSGIIIDAEHVLTSRASLAKNTHFLMYNGLGMIFKAHIDNTFTDKYLARLILESPLSKPNSKGIVGKTPFPGTPIYTLSFPHSMNPNWPLLNVDILGSPVNGRENLYSLNGQNLDYGAGIYNLSGSLIGVVVNDGTATRKVSVLVNESIKNVIKRNYPPKVPADQIYEKALQTHVQLFEGG
jgi:hypothetical protein